MRYTDKDMAAEQYREEPFVLARAKETIEADQRLKAVKESLKEIPFAIVDDLAEADGVVFGTPTSSGICVHR